VGREEFADIKACGRFRAAEGMMEGKWFADSHEGALLHARSLYPDGECQIVAAEVPGEILDRLYRDDNLDRFGPASYLEADEMALIVPLLEWERDDS
jgi:hypothetical protein